jgi:two-component system OmpR family sensor kinase
MILADIAILIILFLIILKMIYPLRGISKSIMGFGEGDYSLRIKNSSKDEIGEVATTFNSMATNIEELITSRETLLRDIGHELKTPITKSKLATEMIEDSKYKSILKRALSEIDEMTSELLDLEKLNANQFKLQMQKFSSETLIAESLSKLFIDDETLIDVKIEADFVIDADLNYLSIALKNLIDNGLKYGVQKPIYIVAKDGSIVVKSRGEKLDKPLEFYCEAFTQGDNSRNQAGYGLGLSLIKRILDKHEFKLSYHYEDGFNSFTVAF